MTTAADTIKAAYREGNLLGINASPTDAQNTEGLALLNGILAACLGYEAGEELSDLNVGGTYDQSFIIERYTFVPRNARLVLNLAGSTAYKLDPEPYEGQRVAVVDAGNCLAANNLTLDGNGRQVEGVATLTLSTNGDNRQWFYRADTGSWARLTGLALTDDLPFPSEFDDYFRILLAMRLNPRYGQELQQSSSLWLERISSQLEARYRKPRPPQDVFSPALLGRTGRGLSWPDELLRSWP